MSRPSALLGKADVTREETGERTLSNHRGRGPGIRGQICRDNAGKELDAAGAHSNLQRLWIRAVRSETEDLGLAHEPVRAMRAG